MCISAVRLGGLRAWQWGVIVCTVTAGDIISVGNPLVSWAPGLVERGRAVLDTGICFKTTGSIQSVRAHFSDFRDGSWPHFLVLEHVESSTAPSTWKVVASSNAKRVSLVGRPTRLELHEVLHVKPGHCLGWHEGSNVSTIGFVEMRPFQQPWILPDGKNQDSFSAAAPVAVEPSSWTGLTLDFKMLHFRRYALMVDLVPHQNSFYHYALHYQEMIRQSFSESHNVKVDDCWVGGPSPEMCCIPAGLGTPWCFDAVYTYERCCKPVVGAAAWVPSKSTPSEALKLLKPNLVEADGTVSSRPKLTVDLFIRTFHKKTQELTHLLHSVALFWPADWGVLVVLDGESDEDEHACALLPSWTRCTLLPKPSFLSQFTKAFSHIDPFGVAGQGLDRHQGLIWKEWSECWADRHSSADFIAVSDSDVVLSTFGIPQLLFQPKSAESSTVRPIIWAHADNVQFPNTIAALNLPWQAEFMDSFPLVVKRSHFKTLRRRIVSLYGQNVTQNDLEADAHFDESFVRYLLHVRKLSEQAGGVECPSFHSMIGSVLWSFHRQEYVWSIRHGHLTGVSLEHTCPRLRVAQHAAYWGRENWMSFGGLPFKHLKVGGRPAILSEVAYAARSSTLILAGLCAVQWMETNTSKHVNYARERQNFRVKDHLRRPDSGLLEVQRDFCSYGLGLAEATSEPEDRLLARAFPAQLWTREESEHCGQLQVENLLEAYRELMRIISFTPPQSPPR